MKIVLYKTREMRYNIGMSVFAEKRGSHRGQHVDEALFLIMELTRVCGTWDYSSTRSISME